MSAGSALEILAQKHAACVANLDQDRACKTCGHEKNGKCMSRKTCYEEVLGMPINPTQWVARDGAR